MNILRLGIIIINDFTLTAFSGFVDVLRVARDYSDSDQLNISWTVMSDDGLIRKSSSGVIIQPESKLASNQNFDYLVVCGGNDYWNPASSHKLINYLKSFTKYENTTFIGICTGTFYLAAAGLITKQRVCIHWNVLDDFKKQFPHIKASSNDIFIEDKLVLTCAGATAAIDLGLFLIDKAFGYHKMKQVIRHMIMDDIRKSTIPQALFYDYLSQNVDARIKKAIHLMERSLDKSKTISYIAKTMGISSKQLERIFIKNINITPYKLYLQIRLNYAAWLIRSTNNSITNISAETGFSDSAHLAREFKKLYKQSPIQYRKHIKV